MAGPSILGIGYRIASCVLEAQAESAPSHQSPHCGDCRSTEARVTGERAAIVICAPRSD